MSVVAGFSYLPQGMRHKHTRQCDCHQPNLRTNAGRSRQPEAAEVRLWSASHVLFKIACFGCDPRSVMWAKSGPRSLIQTLICSRGPMHMPGNTGDDAHPFSQEIGEDSSVVSIPLRGVGRGQKEHAWSKDGAALHNRRGGKDAPFSKGPRLLVWSPGCSRGRPGDFIRFTEPFETAVPRRGARRQGRA